MNEQTREHGPLLTAWLALMLVANVATAFIYGWMYYLATANNAALNNLLSFMQIPLWAIMLFVALAAVNVLCAASLFLWRKIGFFVLCTSAAVAFAVNILLGVGFFSAFGFAAPIILFLAMRSQWKLFK